MGSNKSSLLLEQPKTKNITKDNIKKIVNNTILQTHKQKIAEPICIQLMDNHNHINMNNE